MNDVCMRANKKDNNEEANDNQYIAPALQLVHDIQLGRVALS